VADVHVTTALAFLLLTIHAAWRADGITGLLGDDGRSPGWSALPVHPDTSRRPGRNFPRRSGAERTGWSTIADMTGIHPPVEETLAVSSLSDERPGAQEGDLMTNDLNRWRRTRERGDAQEPEGGATFVSGACDH
jgi:hypothetical protein